MGFRARLGTFIALAVGLTVALAALVSYFTVRDQLLSEVDSSLRGSWAINAYIDSSEASSILKGNEGFVQVIGPQEIFGSSLTPPLTPSPAEQAIATEPGHSIIETISYQGGANAPELTVTEHDAIYTSLGATAKAPVHAEKSPDLKTAALTMSRRVVANGLNELAKKPDFKK